MASTTKVLVVSDFDGTIAEVVERFAFTRLADGAERALSRLAALRDVRVAVISGRAADDTLERCKGLRHVHLFAEHGAVMLQGAFATSLAPAHHLERLPQLVVQTARMAVPITGARIETKAGGVALHLRGVAEHERPPLVERFRALASEAGAHILEGRLVVEARFRLGDKGSVVRMLLGADAQSTAVIYAGDDDTDASAYELVGRLPHGFAFHVRSTECPTPRAPVRAFLESPADWIATLERLGRVLSTTRERAA